MERIDRRGGRLVPLGRIGLMLMAVGAVLGVSGLVQTTSAQVRTANCAYGSAPVVPLGGPADTEGGVAAACEPEPEESTTTTPSTTEAPTTTAAPTTTTPASTTAPPTTPASTTAPTAPITTTPTAVPTTTAAPVTTVAVTAAPPGPAVLEDEVSRSLAVTGGTSTPLVLGGLLAMLGGASLVTVSRLRDRRARS